MRAVKQKRSPGVCEDGGIWIVGKLYALLVGSDAYQPPLSALTGCLNDVAAMEEFLTKRLSPDKRSLKILRDKEATRQGLSTPSVPIWVRQAHATPPFSSMPATVPGRWLWLL